MLALVIGGAVLCVLLLIVWFNRRATLAGRTEPRIIRNPCADWLALASTAVPSLLHLGLSGWQADFSVPFKWHVFCMWGGWLASVATIMWNHWDDPVYWVSDGSKRRWWI